jgi:hypothetical protein
MIMYMITGTDPNDLAEVAIVRGQVFVSEDGAYAALGRIAVLTGSAGDMAVQRLEVVGEVGSPIEAPGWIRRRFPRGVWGNGRPGLADPNTVMARDPDGDWSTILIVTGGSTTEEDADAAEWLATVISRELN